MSHTGKRKRHTEAPLSALAARKARQPLTPSRPRTPSPQPLEEPQLAEASSSSSEDEAIIVQQVAEAAEAIAVDPVPGRQRQRYFAGARVATPDPVEAIPQSSPSTPARPAQPVMAPAAAQPRRQRHNRIDPSCASTWQPRHGENLQQEGDHIIIQLEKDETLILHGVCTIEVKQGSVTVSGASFFPPTSFPLFSPSLASLPVLRATSKTELELRSLRTGIEGVNPLLYLSDFIGRTESVWTSASSQRLLPSALGFDIILEPRNSLLASAEPSSWTAALVKVGGEREDGSERLLVEGVPRVGKSAFARMALNTLLQQQPRVAWIDCDLGQPEFTPPGFVSLHLLASPIIGPPFTHPRLPTRAHFIGVIESRSNPAHYLACIADLVSAYHDQEGSIPLVVNLPGWAKGFSADLQTSIEQVVKPTLIYRIGECEEMPPPAVEAETASLEGIGDLGSEVLRLHSQARRALNLVAYFSCTAFTPTPTWDFSTPLIAQLPRCLPLSSLSSVHALLPEAPPEPEMLRLLNGSVVALIAGPSEGRERPIYTAEPPNPTETHALGLALIRSIDPSGPALHLLTPLPLSILHEESPRILARGTIEIPTVCLVDPNDANGSGVTGVEWKDVPFLSPSAASKAVGSGTRKVRRNLMRRSQR